MSISEMGVMCSKMSPRLKRNILNIERSQQIQERGSQERVRVLHQKCLKTEVHIVRFMEYIFLNSLYINYVLLSFKVIVDAKVQLIRTFSVEEHNMKKPESPFFIGDIRHTKKLETNGKKDWQPCEGNVRGRWNSKKKSKLQRKEDKQIPSTCRCPLTIIQQLSCHQNGIAIYNYSTASNEKRRHMSSILTNYHQGARNLQSQESTVTQTLHPLIDVAQFCRLLVWCLYQTLTTLFIKH